MLYLFVEDVVANGIIELNKMNGSREISISVAEAYGNLVIKKLNEQGYYAKMKLSKELICHFEKLYANFFIVSEEESEKKYILRNDKMIEDVIHEFRDGISNEILISFVNPEVTNILLANSVCKQYPKLEVISEDRKKLQLVLRKDDRN